MNQNRDENNQPNNDEYMESLLSDTPDLHYRFYQRCREMAAAAAIQLMILVEILTSKQA